MPELPEMETYRQNLMDKLLGQTITDVQIHREKCINLSREQFQRQVKGNPVTDVKRRAKQLLIRLGSGKFLLVHLMLGGWMFYGRPSDAPDRDAQIVLTFGDEQLYFFGLRFGYVHLLTEAEMMEQLADLGPEPLSSDFTEEGFRAAVAGKRSMLKNTLVDQHFIAGIGTRYSDEICFGARLLPLKTCSDLTEEDIVALYRTIPKTLQDAIDHGGYMSRPFFKGDTWTGGFADSLKVYKRDGEACERCGHSIKKDQISSRKVYYCPHCQR